jgi:O-antigen/teichoic acid export membrane protein
MRGQTSWVVMCRVVGILTTVAGNILAARLLGPAEFGRYLFLFSVAVCGGLLAVAGLSDSVLRFTSANLALGHRQLAVSYVRRTARLGILSTLVAIGVTATCLFVFQRTTGKLTQPGLLVVLTVLTLSALACQQWASETLRGWNNLKLASLFSGGTAGGPLSTLLFLFGIVGLMLAQVSVTAAGIVGLLAASVCLTVPFALWSVWRTVHRNAVIVTQPAPLLTSVENRQLLSMAGTVLAINLLSFVGEQVDIWIGKTLLQPDEFGVYGVAKRCMLLSAMPVQLAMLAVLGAIPRLHAQNRRRELQDLMRGSAGLAAIPSLVALTLLVLFPHFTLQLLFGASYDAAAPLIRILAVGYLMVIFVGNPINLLILTGGHRTSLLVNLIAGALVAIGGPLAATRFGASGLASISALALMLQSTLLWLLARRQSGIWTHIGRLRLKLADEPSLDLESATRLPENSKPPIKAKASHASQAPMEVASGYSVQPEACTNLLCANGRQFAGEMNLDSSLGPVR